MTSLVVSTRPGERIVEPKISELMEQRLVPMEELQCAGQIAQLTMTALDISSSSIRHLAKRGESLDFLLPSAVLNYINQNGLYQA